MHDDRQPFGDGRHGDAVHVEWDTVDDLTSSLLTAVAAETGTRPTDLPPLHDAIDPDAMGAVLTTGQPSEPIRLSFTYTGLRVRIDSDGFLSVEQRPSESD